MKLGEFFDKLRVLKVKSVYIIHKENLNFSESFDVRCFADRLKKAGFIPLMALDFRPFGKTIVSKAISLCDFSIVLALDKDTEIQARKEGVDFVYIEEFGKS